VARAPPKTRAKGTPPASKVKKELHHRMIPIIPSTKATIPPTNAVINFTSLGFYLFLYQIFLVFDPLAEDTPPFS
jgi:hypothetical protein